METRGILFETAVKCSQSNGNNSVQFIGNTLKSHRRIILQSSQLSLNVLVDYFDMLILVIMVYIIVKYKHFGCFC